MATGAGTYFEEKGEVIPALLHAEKARLLCNCQTSNIAFDALLRLVADNEDPEFLRVVATLNNFCGDSRPGQRSCSVGESSEDKDKDTATDKHKILWLAPLEVLRESLPSVGATLGESGELWERGSLHLIEAAPKLSLIHI